MKPLNKKAIRSYSFILIGALILFTSASLKAADQKLATLKLKPTKCVALHHGQECFSDLDISFVAIKQADYCLFSSDNAETPIKCWENQSQGLLKDEIVTVNNILFTLRKKGEHTILAHAEFKVAWVYRKNSRAKSAWRVF